MTENKTMDEFEEVVQAITLAHVKAVVSSLATVIDGQMDEVFHDEQGTLIDCLYDELAELMFGKGMWKFYRKNVYMIAEKQIAELVKKHNHHLVNWRQEILKDVRGWMRLEELKQLGGDK